MKPTIRLSLFWSFIFIQLVSQSAKAQTPAWVWPPDSLPDQVENMSLGQAMRVFNAADGAVLTTGSFNGARDFDPGSGEEETLMMSSENGNQFMVKLSESGDLMWAIQSSVFLNVSGTDSEGNIYLIYTGANVQNNPDVDPGEGVVHVPYTSGYHLVKLSSDAEYLGMYSCPLTHHLINGISEVFVTDDSDVYLVGVSDGDIINESPEVNAPLGFFVIHLNNQMEYVSSWIYPVTGGENAVMYATDIYMSDEGRLYMSGSAKKFAIDFDPGSGENMVTMPESELHGFVAELDTATGSAIWVVPMMANWAMPYGLTADGEGNLLITGHFSTAGQGMHTPDSNVELHSQGQDSFIMKLSSDGEYLWSAAIGGPQEEALDQETGFEALTDSHNYVYIRGSFVGTVDFDPGLGVLERESFMQVGDDSYILKLSPDGEFVWVMTSILQGYGDMDMDDADNLYCVGRCLSATDFDGTDGEFMVYAPGYFVAKYGPQDCDNMSINLLEFTPPSCGTEGSAEVQTSGATPPVTYAWDIYTSEGNGGIHSLPFGVVEITATDGTGCTRSTSVLASAPSSEEGFDLESHATTSAAQSGYQSNVRLHAMNNGCVSTDGEVRFVPGEWTSYVSASPVPTTVSGDTLIWQLDDQVFGAENFVADILLDVSAEAMVGDTICHRTMIYPMSGDANAANNEKTICQAVLNAYDPNLKYVYPEGSCAEHYTPISTEELTYTIHFQNTGNTAAVNVSVLDTLHDILDLSRLSVKASSHEMIPVITGERSIRFQFNGIMLPDSLSDPEGSKGYVVFSVPFSGTPDEGMVVSNKAYIYFDFNEPVITPEAWNTFVTDVPQCSVVSVENAEASKPLFLFPNPASDQITITDVKAGDEVRIMDMTGREVMRSKVLSTHHTVNVSAFSPGVYQVMTFGEGAMKRTGLVIQY